MKNKVAKFSALLLIAMMSITTVFCEGGKVWKIPVVTREGTQAEITVTMSTESIQDGTILTFSNLPVTKNADEFGRKGVLGIQSLMLYNNTPIVITNDHSKHHFIEEKGSKVYDTTKDYTFFIGDDRTISHTVQYTVENECGRRFGTGSDCIYEIEGDKLYHLTKKPTKYFTGFDRTEVPAVTQ